MVITLKDINGNAIRNVDVDVNLNGVKTLTTDGNGQVKISTNGLVPKKYTVNVTFNGNAIYEESFKEVGVTVKKATPILTAKVKTFEVSVKTKKYTVTLKDNQNKAMKNTYVTLKVNKRTYKVKTNSNGQAIFKITNLNKKGTFTVEVKYAGDSCYNAKTVNAKIIVK